MRRIVLAQVMVLGAVLLMGGLASATALQPDVFVLVQVGGAGHADLLAKDWPVDVYAQLTSGSGPYLLAGTSPDTAEVLRDRGLQVAVLDANPRADSYYLAYPLPGRPHPDWNTYGQILLDDGVQVLLRIDARDTAQLTTEADVEIAALDLEPITVHSQFEGAIPDTVHYNPYIEALLSQVDQTTLYQYEAWLTGEDPADIGGAPYTLVTRHTYSGTPIEKATQFAYEYLGGLGLDVEYHNWDGIQYPNVVATRVGQRSPDDIYVICAHLDDMPAGPVAPGADDNASGSAAVLMAANILSQYDWGCTLKFALWTGEEQGLLGSNAWAEEAHDAGLDILGVFNMDMIAYDSDETPAVDLHVRSHLPDTLAIAHVFTRVVDLYDLDLVPNVLIDNSLGNYSDNKSFWDEGYAAILAIEDYDDFAPYYHTVQDQLSTLNLAYFAEFVKASVGTFVHMSDCLILPYQTYLPLVAHEEPISAGALIPR
jgi:hypothetical protein